MTVIYRNEPFQQVVSIEVGGAPLTGLSIELDLIDEFGSRLAGPSPTAIEAPPGTYTATLPASATAAVGADKARRRLRATAGGYEQRDDKSIKVTYRPFED